MGIEPTTSRVLLLRPLLYCCARTTAQIMLQVILFELFVLNALSVYMRNEPIIQITYAADSDM